MLTHEQEQELDTFISTIKILEDNIFNLFGEIDQKNIKRAHGNDLVWNHRGRLKLSALILGNAGDHLKEARDNNE